MNTDIPVFIAFYTEISKVFSVNLTHGVLCQSFIPLISCIAPVLVGNPCGYEDQNPGSDEHGTVKEGLIDCKGTD